MPEINQQEQSCDQILRMNVAKKGKVKKTKKVVKQQQQNFGFSINLEEEEPELPQQSPMIDTNEDFKIIEVVRTQIEQPEPPSQPQTSSNEQPLADPAELSHQLQNSSHIESIEPKTVQKTDYNNPNISQRYEAGQKPSTNQEEYQPLKQVELLAEDANILKEELLVDPKAEQKQHQETLPPQVKVDYMIDDSEVVFQQTRIEKKVKKQSVKTGTKKKSAKTKGGKSQISQIILETEIYDEHIDQMTQSIRQNLYVQAPSTNKYVMQQINAAIAQANQSPEVGIQDNIQKQRMPIEQVIDKNVSQKVEEMQQQLQPMLQATNQIQSKLQSQIQSKMKQQEPKLTDSATEALQIQEIEFTGNVVGVSKKGKKSKKKQCKVKKTTTSFNPQMFVQADILEEEQTNHNNVGIPALPVQYQLTTQTLGPSSNSVEVDRSQLIEPTLKYTNTPLPETYQPDSNNHSAIVNQPTIQENVDEQVLQQSNKLLKLEENPTVKSVEDKGCLQRRSEEILRERQDDDKEQKSLIEVQNQHSLVDNIVLSVAKKKTAKKENNKKGLHKKAIKQPALQFDLTESIQVQETPKPEPTTAQISSIIDENIQKSDNHATNSDINKVEIVQNSLKSVNIESMQLPSEVGEELLVPSEPIVEHIMEEKQQSSTPQGSYTQELESEADNFTASAIPIQQQINQENSNQCESKDPVQQFIVSPLSLSLETKGKKTVKKNVKNTNKSKNNQKPFLALNIELEDQKQALAKQALQTSQNGKQHTIEAKMQLQVTEKLNKSFQEQTIENKITDNQIYPYQAQKQSDNLNNIRPDEIRKQQQVSDLQKIQAQPQEPLQIQMENQVEQNTPRQLETQALTESLPKQSLKKQAAQSSQKQSEEEIMLLGQITKPKIKGTKKGKKGGEKLKNITKDSQAKSHFADIRVQQQPSPFNNLVIQPQRSHNSLQISQNALPDTIQTSVIIQDRPMELNKQKAYKYTPKADERFQQPTKVLPILKKVNASSNSKAIMRELVEMVSIQGDQQVRCIKQRLRMLEEDIRSRLQRKQQQVLHKREVIGGTVLSGKAKIYSAIISENIALRDQMRNKQVLT